MGATIVIPQFWDYAWETFCLKKLCKTEWLFFMSPAWVALVHDPLIQDPTMHIPSIIMQPCLLYIEITYDITGRKNIGVICRDWFPGWRKQAWPKTFSFLIFSDEMKCDDIWGNCFNRLCQFLRNWIKLNMIFKSSCLQMFYKLGVLKYFTKFTWKHIRPATAKKTPFSQNTSRWLLWDFSYFLLFFDTKRTNRNQVFSNFEHVL